MLSLAQRAHQLLDLEIYKQASTDVTSWPLELSAPDDQYILRMMVRAPWVDGTALPPELEWIRSVLAQCDEHQRIIGVNHAFVYITVRNGLVRSIADDVWHADGFSMRKPHLPEQNYIWCDNNGTEMLNQIFDIPSDFDPLKHNIHHFFQDMADDNRIIKLQDHRLYQIDPYIIHRRPTLTMNTMRKFFRISYVPIEIENDDCTQNPLLPFRHYGLVDIRKQLQRYSV